MISWNGYMLDLKQFSIGDGLYTKNVSNKIIYAHYVPLKWYKNKKTIENIFKQLSWDVCVYSIVNFENSTIYSWILLWVLCTKAVCTKFDCEGNRTSVV